MRLIRLEGDGEKFRLLESHLSKSPQSQMPYFCYLLALRPSDSTGSRNADDSIQTSFEFRDKLRSMRQ